MSKGEHVGVVAGCVLVGAQGGHRWLYVVFLFGGDKDCFMIDDVQQFDDENYQADKDNEKGGKTSAFMIELCTSLDFEVSGLREKVN